MDQNEYIIYIKSSSNNSVNIKKDREVYIKRFKG